LDILSKRTPSANFNVPRLIATDRHIGLGQVGKRSQPFIDLVQNLFILGLGLVKFVPQPGNFRKFGRGVFTAPLALPHQFRKCVATGLKFFSTNLNGLTPGFECPKRIHVEGDTACSEPLGNSIEVLTQQLNIDHGEFRTIRKDGRKTFRLNVVRA
jgi:hypothetical protein